MAAFRKAIIKQRDYEQKHWAEIQARKHNEIEKEIKKKFDKVLASLDDDGEHLIIAANRFLKLAEQNAIIMEQLEDGSCTLNQP